MKTRIISGLVMAALGIPVLFLSHTIAFPIALSLLAVIAVWELLGLFEFRKSFAVFIPAYLIAGALPIVSFGMRTLEGAIDFLISVATIALCLMLYLIGYAVCKRGKVKLSDVSLFYVYFVYVIMAFTSLALLRYIPNGVFYFMMIPIASWICDIFAYFVGFAIGKHKLIPEVSPKKTWEGAIGGVYFATMAFLVYGIVLHFIEDAPTPNYTILCILGLVLSIVSQIGDLSASLLKRERGKKDFGALFPGHGGVLDRFDSFLPVAPILLVTCMIWPPLS